MDRVTVDGIQVEVDGTGPPDVLPHDALPTASPTYRDRLERLAGG